MQGSNTGGSMNRLFVFALLWLAACSGESFTQGERDGGAGAGGDGIGGDGGGGGGASTTTTGTAGSSTTSHGGGGANSGGGGSGGSGGTCVPTKTCEGEKYNCGLLDDGCGNMLDCGPYSNWTQCDGPKDPPYACTCDVVVSGISYFHAVSCFDGVSDPNTPPPAGFDCVETPDPNFTGFAWCCTQAVP